MASDACFIVKCFALYLSFYSDVDKDTAHTTLSFNSSLLLQFAGICVESDKHLVKDYVCNAFLHVLLLGLEISKLC